MATLWLEPVRRGRRHLLLRYGVDELSFSTTYWYDDVDLEWLATIYGEGFLRRVEFHLLAFEANKAASLAPDAIDFGPYADLVTEPFWELWETLFHNVWGVWRYENDLPDYRLPRPAGRLSENGGAPAVVVDASGRLLLLCGGGKDSLVCMKLLERGGVAYDTFAYSHSTYGPAAFQHELIGGLLAHCAPRAEHRGWVFDDALEAPVAETHPELGIRRILAAETVSSYWTALPVALQHGFTEVALGVTRSTDEHNLVWDVTGEQINYLWGMSSDAEQLLHDYVRDYLVSDLSMFHLLRPVYDVNVFSMLRTDLAAVPSTHSCARQKPWCCSCAKCIYVWMNYVAWLPQETVSETFEVNLFEIPDNRSLLRKMLGLESYKPTDCVGTVSEARLAFAMCRAKGIGGVIAEDIDVHELIAEAAATLDRYGAVAPPGATFPPSLANRLRRQLEKQSRVTQTVARAALDLPSRT